MFLPLNSFENICVCFLLMIIYSTAGWVGEMIYHSIVIKHLSEKRGFLNGFLMRTSDLCIKRWRIFCMRTCKKNQCTGNH